MRQRRCLAQARSYSALIQGLRCALRKGGIISGGNALGCRINPFADAEVRSCCEGVKLDRVKVGLQG